MTNKIYYEADTDLSLIRNKKVAIIGYGSQGHAHALNLHENQVDVTVGLHPESQSREKAQTQGLKVSDVAEATAQADLIMILAPDEIQADLFRDQIQPQLKPGATIGFGHGFNIHFQQIIPKDDINVIMIAPKGPGHTVRSTFRKGAGVPALVAVEQDPSGSSLDLALSYASAIGAGRVGIIETNFQEETETDLFGEQAVLCGGITELIKNGFEVLVEAGYSPHLSYFECLHEVKLIVDLLYEGGISNMTYSISNTAEYGGYASGPRVIDPATKDRMKGILQDIQSGKFAAAYLSECSVGMPSILANRRMTKQHLIEQVGEELREMMASAFTNERLVDKSQN